MEVWREIPSIPGFWASDLGNIRTRRGRPAYIRIGSDGYTEFAYWKTGKSLYRRVHSAVAEAHLGPRPPGLECAHLDGIRTNPALSNLQYVTPRENAAHKILHGTDLAGERNHQAVLTEIQVLVIRRRVSLGARPARLATQYGVSESNIRQIAFGHTWTKLGGPISTPRPMRRPRPRLTYADACEIRGRCADGERQSDVARSLGVGKQAINRIVLGKTLVQVPHDDMPVIT